MSKRISTNLIALAFLTVSVALALAAQDKYTVKVPGGLAFSDFRGYEDWQAVGPSLTDAQNVIRVILANPVMIKAYRDGVPGNGKPFPTAPRLQRSNGFRKRLPTRLFPRPRRTRCRAPSRRLSSSRRMPSDFRTATDGDTRCSITTRRPIRSRPAPQRTGRRRRTTPSAGSRATTWRRLRITFSRRTGSGETPFGPARS